MRHPCAKCPWRQDAPLNLWPDEELQRMYVACQDDGISVMCCHANRHLPMDDPRVVPCIGWAWVLRFDAIGVRIAVMTERLTVEQIEATDGPQLYVSFDAMLEANGIALPPRNRVTPRRVP
jgi:hypothetical protein